MQEVEAICDRAIIINKGKLVADDSTQNLKKKTQKQCANGSFWRDGERRPAEKD